MIEKPERISLCFNQIQIYVPRSLQDIAMARRLLDMLEEELKPSARQPEWVCELWLQDREANDEAEKRERERISNYPTQTDASDPPEYEAKPISTGEQEDLGTKTSKPPENAPERILSIPKMENLFIPKFKWDKTKENFYRTIFFYEHEDGRVMISYMQSKLFTTKDVVLTLPYPVPRGYAPLQNMDNNKRTALRFYREYLAKLAYSAENNEEDEIMSEAAREAEEKRLEKLKKTAEVNKDRWKDRVETEMSARTKELRKNIVLKARLGVEDEVWER